MPTPTRENPILREVDARQEEIERRLRLRAKALGVDADVIGRTPKEPG